jgi:GGDEF domain-containing protein
MAPGAGALQRLIGASVGLATTGHPGADDGDRLLREADEAMYRVKQAAKGGFTVSTAGTQCAHSALTASRRTVAARA